MKAYALGAFTDGANDLTYIGVAKDGHAVVGPYSAPDTLFDCATLDLCGGTYLSTGEYVYVMSNTFPYGIYCYGPGPSQKYTASCSTNTCSISNAKRLGVTLFQMAFIALSVFFFVA